MNNLKILYTNIRSLHAHFDELLLTLASLTQGNTTNYDVIALSESWISEEQLTRYQISGYRSFISPRASNRRSGGVVAYVRKDLQINNIKKVEVEGADALSVDIKAYNQVLTLLLVYRECTSSRARFIDSLEQTIDNIGAKNRETIILGDMNVNLLNKNSSTSYLNMMRSNGFESILNDTTRDRNCIDHVFVNNCKLQLNAELSHLSISDHAIIEISVKSKDKRRREEGGKKEKVIIDEEKFLNNLKAKNWSWVNVTDNVNRAFEYLFTVIRSCRDEATRKMYIKSNTKKAKLRQPWMTQKLAKLSVEKSVAYKKHREDRENAERKRIFKGLSAKLKGEIRKAKINYYSGLLNKNSKNPREYWNIVNEVRGTDKKQIIDKIMLHQRPENVLGNEKVIAEKFNLHFNKIPETLLLRNGIKIEQARLKHDSDVPLPRIETDNNIKLHTKLEIFQISESDVERAVLQAKNKRCCGADNILPTTIKRQPKFFAKILTPLFNLSLRKGIFPEMLKEIIIVPIHKNGDKTQVENYRPIALTSAFSKIFEISVKEKFWNYLEHIKFFAPNQYGFLKTKSTDTALFKHITDITTNIENNRPTIGVYLDFAKAFDTIDHVRLCGKLQKTGIRGPLLNWFLTYLTNRKHRTRINDTLSTELTSKYGVPQGSVLGPFLFIIYINDLYSLPLKAEVITFADDTSLLYSGKTKEQILNDFQHDQDILLPWFKSNLIHLNADKCKYMVFAYKTPEWANTIQVKTDQGALERVKEIKYLGIKIDEKLTWKAHSVYLQTKLSKQNYLFYHLKNHFNTWHLQKLYPLLYESVLGYGIVHWGASAHIQPIKVLQNKYVELSSR